MSRLFHPANFTGIPGLAAALSLRDPREAGEFSMKPTNTNESTVQANRMRFAEMLHFNPLQLAVANQDHTGIVEEVQEGYDPQAAPQADALITTAPGWLIGVTIADCIGVILYDPEHRAIGVIHSGRKGTAQHIAANTVKKMQEAYQTNPAELTAYLSPCPNPDEYPIDLETAKSCDPRYLSPAPNSDEAYFDNRQAVLGQLVETGIRPGRIEVDPRSTVGNPQLHSYRRDRDEAGRMLLAVGLFN